MDILKLQALMDMLGSSRLLGTPSKRDRSNFRPTGAALRNPNDPVQAERIEAAKFKRAERAVKAQRYHDRCIAGGL